MRAIIHVLLFCLSGSIAVAQQNNSKQIRPPRTRDSKSINNTISQKIAQQGNGVTAASDFTAVATPTTTAGATTLAQTLAGPGVIVSNAHINCASGGAGTFSYTGSTLGISNGIVLTTGAVSDIGHYANIVGEFEGHDYTDANLTSLVSNATYDVCLLTFEFVPICSSISITYEFGSSEYDGYQCSSFNDAFGLFLAGPNPAGGNYAAHNNIAILPGTTTAVNINNVNDGSAPCTSAHNSSYYIPNYTGTDIVYEGLTTAITSTAAVTPCQTYTMEIAIGDAGDEDYDSGVFLKNNALSCPSNLASATSPAACGASTGSASVTVSSYTGTPTYTWSPGGQNTSSISSQAAGTYTCSVGLTQCSSVYTETITAIISPTTTPVTVTVNSAT